ncbi:MAG: 20S proteasome subunit A/B [Gammaproteobacteria bacterium]
MTYCVALSLRDGLIFASDSRTNAGSDYVTSYAKMHQFAPAPDRFFVLLSAGNLATTQEVINYIRRDLDHPDGSDTLNNARYMFEAADYVGRISVQVQQRHGPTLQQAGVAGETTLILGGQIQGEPPRLFMIYPQGNAIEVSETTPYLQIGETKYGKPVLDRVVHRDMSMEDGARLALVSLSSTAHSNTAVGPPFELSMYRNDAFKVASHCRFADRGEFLTQMEEAWKRGLQQTFDNLPRFDWEVDNSTGELFQTQALPVQQAGSNAMGVSQQQIEQSQPVDRREQASTPTDSTVPIQHY